MARALEQRRAIVTGASSGIGRALCGRLAERGVSLVITARRSEALGELTASLRDRYAVTVVSVTGDITSMATRGALLDAALTNLGGLDLLVNNAGAGAAETVDVTSEETARRLMELNFFAPLLLTQAALPLLRESRQSRGGGERTAVVFLGSVVGLRGTPHYGVYGAAKAAVANLADALRAELAREKLGVLTVSPGTTATAFFDALLENRSQPHFPPHRSVSSEVVADGIVEAIRRNRHRIVPHCPSKILDWLQRLSPRLVDSIMARYR